MKILVDTHCWLWLQASPERLTDRALEHLANPDNEIFLSAASAWEIAIKHALGKLPLPRPPGVYVTSRMARTNTSALPVTVQHALRVAKLPPLHRDPFDRVLVAQAQVEKMVLLSADPLVLAYDVKTMRA